MQFIIYISFIKLILIYSYLTKAHFHTSIKLDNGNFVIFTYQGQYILDQTFKILYKYNASVLGSDNYDMVKQYSKEDEGYIIYMTNNNHYILNSYGNCLFSTSISSSLKTNVFSIIPYNHQRDKIFYYLIYFYDDTDVNIRFRRYSYNSTNNQFNSKDFYSDNIYSQLDYLITCQLMKYSNEKVISCFFVTYLNNEYFLNCTVFKSEEDFKVIQTSQIKIEANSIYRLGSEVILNNERQKALVVLSIYYNQIYCLFYAGYDIHIKNFTYGYLIENHCNLYSDHNYYFSISYFKETEEFIVSALNKCTFNSTSNYCFLIYSFDNNFEYSFLGILNNLVLGDTCCKMEPLKIYKNNLHSIFFSSVAQKYCIILNLNYTNVTSMFIINKEVHIVNQTELKSSDSPIEFICENYSNYKNESCTNNLSLIDGFKKLSERKYIEKCTSEINYITSNFTCKNYIYKSFEFSFNCSEKYPYEIVETNNSNNIKITENIINTDSYKVINKQSDIISTEIENKDIMTNSKGTILETGKIESNSSISSDSNIITNSKDAILETENKESDRNINSESNLITNTIELYNYQTINKLINTNVLEYTTISSFEQKIYDLLNDIINDKSDNNTNFNDNIKNIFSDSSNYNVFDNIINGDKDIIISNNEAKSKDKIIIQITTTDNQRNNKNNNISTVNFGECEDTLKSIYNINPNKSLLILKIDSYIDGSNIPVIQYELYHPDNKSKLNLSFCNNKIEINIPVSIDENNLYKYEPDSDYYNDRCYSYTTNNGNDIPLEYRRKEFTNNKMSLCESECNYKGYDYETKKSKCECKLKNEISIFFIKIDTERLYNQFTGLTSSNIDIIKCYYLLFQKKNLLYNIGFYVILFIIFIFCIGAIIFILKGYNLLVQKIDIIIKTNHLLNTRLLNNMNRKRKKIKKKSNKNNKNKSKKKENPPKKRTKNKNKNRKERNNRFNLTNEAKSIQKLNSKSNENIIKNINIEKGEKKKDIKKGKHKFYKINKSKLVTDVPYSKKKFLNKSKVYMNDYELNRLPYKDAIKYDKRTYIQYYWSLLKIGNLFLFSFMPNNDYNSMAIKICLFFFSFALYYTVNALFFTDTTMNKIYEDNGQYDFIYQLPKILYSNLICTVINLIVKYLSLSEKDIVSIKIMLKEENVEKKIKSRKKCLKIKFFFFYIVSFLFLFIFLFYTSCFCAVYRNTQIYLIKDTLISFSLSLLYPLCYYLVPGIFRLPALRNRNKNKNCTYKISLLLQSI